MIDALLLFKGRQKSLITQFFLKKLGNSTQRNRKSRIQIDRCSNLKTYRLFLFIEMLNARVFFSK